WSAGRDSSRSAAAAHSASTSCWYAAATRASRLGKWRYRVPIPSPARVAMLSRATCSPSAANAAVAADSSLSRLRRTSARGRLGLAVTLTTNSLSKSEVAPFLLDNTEDPPFILNPRSGGSSVSGQPNERTHHMIENQTWSITAAGRRLGVDGARNEPSHIHV